jgi:hypothetical protein
MIKGFKAIPLKGFSHYTVSKDGRVSSLKTGKILKPHLTSSGYHTVCLSAGSGNSKTVRVHRLVALTYIDKSNKKHNVVNHKDGDKTNNKLSNLEWTDAKGNSLHYQTELRPKKIKTIKTTKSVDILGVLKTLHGSVSMETFSVVFKELTKA